MEIKLSAQVRKDKERLDADFMPAVIYGKGLVTSSLKIKKSDFEKAFKAAGESNLIDLDFGQGAVKTLIKDTQRDIMKGFFTHADFYQVNMKENIMTEIPLHFIGESKAIKELGGTLIKDMDSVEVECLPSDLVDHIDVDISVLKTYSDAIHVSDLTLPKGLTLVHHTNEMVAAVKEPRVEEEPVPVAEAAAAAAPGTEGAGTEAKKEPEKK
jgi:large subunit ribosomal protein L25